MKYLRSTPLTTKATGVVRADRNGHLAALTSDLVAVWTRNQEVYYAVT